MPLSLSDEPNCELRTSASAFDIEQLALSVFNDEMAALRVDGHYQFVSLYQKVGIKNLSEDSQGAFGNTIMACRSLLDPALHRDPS